MSKQETDCLFINVDEENWMANETDYPCSMHSSQENVIANKIDNDHLSIQSGRRENTMANKIDDDQLSSNRSGWESVMAKRIDYDHSSIHSGRENEMANKISFNHLSMYSGREDAMGDEKDDQLSVLQRLNQKLHKLSPKPCDGPSIFKVPKHLRKVNAKAYEPQVLAIGPYHAAKNHLKEMEEQKVHYLKMLLEQNREHNLTSYVSAMSELEARACACYVELDSVDKDIRKKPNWFSEMMLLDACFIVQLLRRYETSQRGVLNDHILKGGWIMSALRRDLLLAENQLPFFVVQKFYDMTEDPQKKKHFSDLIFSFFNDIVPECELKNNFSHHEGNHLLDLIHKSWSPISPENRKSKNASETARYNWGFIRCATELKEAGIKFKMKKVETEKLFHKKFDNGRLKIPKLKIDDNSESFFRNLIAYEQSLQNPDVSYVIDYLKFMNCLMNTSKDVELLCQSEIVDNGLGDDEVLANMINRLCDNVTFSRNNFMYSEIFDKVNDHCKRSWNKWIANLRHKYFNTPWALISFLAAVLLLLLTLAQTVFSALEYNANN